MSAGAVDLRVRSRMSSHSRIRYSKSRLISVLDRSLPAVRTMTPMPSGTSRSLTRSLSRRRSVMLVILRETPPPRGVFGMSTQYRPAFDHFLDLVVAMVTDAGALRLLDLVAADSFDRLCARVLLGLTLDPRLP